MVQNKFINERNMDSKFKNINNNNTYFCAKCLRELDSENRDVVKDVDNNIFCDKICRSEFYKENYLLILEIIGY